MEVPPNSTVYVCPTLPALCGTWYWVTPTVGGIHRCPECGMAGEVARRTGDADPQASAADAA
jgi:hypothetical protein